MIDGLPSDAPTTPTDVATLIRSAITSYPDFPTEGVLFRDLSPVFADADLLRLVIDSLLDGSPDADLIGGVEARGFVLAAAAATVAATGMLAIRKAGKLPGMVLSESYDLEYGAASLELHPSEGGDRRVYLLDDVLATGGTLAAAARLLERCGYTVAGIGVVIELEKLGGRSLLEGYEVRSLLTL